MSDHELARRQILYGLLAFQNGFVTIEDLVAALAAWSAEKSRPLREVLSAEGKIDAEAASLLEALVARYVSRHSGSTEASLEALAGRVPPRVLDELGDIADPDVEKTVTELIGSRPSGGTPSMTPTEPWTSGEGAESTALYSGPRPPEGFTGRFRKIRHLADDHGVYGHMGLIWIAKDEELHREVALKEILPRQADDPEAQSRFVREAELGGGLEHPGVVPIYSLGTGPDGHLQFAMRLIHGESLRQALTRHHDPDRHPIDPAEHHLEFRGLLARFIDACNAIAYAHDRGVIHRDIKPANIMLGRYGETLVIDWGLARTIDRPEAVAREAGGLLRPPSVSGTDYRDEAGQVIGTPAYIPPESIAGQPNDPGTAGDIYSLGVTLYVILTGRNPFQGSVHAVLDQVRAGQFPKPREVKPGVPKALEAICLKAMSHQPSDRYATARELAKEIERWLGDEPVAAYPDPLLVRVGRWMRRNQPLVAGLGALLATAAVALAVGLWRVDLEKQRTAVQKSRAEGNYQTARRLALDILSLAENPDSGLVRLPGASPIVAQMITLALQPFVVFQQQDPDNPEVLYDLARLRIYEGNVERTMNLLDQADQRYAEAVRLLERLLQESPESPRYRDRLNEALRDRSQLLLRRGLLTRAAEDLHSVLDHAERMREQDPESPAFRRTSGTVMLDLAGIQSRRGEHTEALELATKAVDLMRGLAAMPNHHPLDPLLLVLALEKKAIALRELGQLDEALKVHEEGIAAARLLAESPNATNNDRNFHCRAILERCRTLARRPEDRETAERELAPAITDWQDLVAKYTDVPNYRERLGESRTVRASLRIELGRLDDAEADLTPAREGLERLVSEFPQVPSYRGNLGITMATQGRLALARNNPSAAVERLDEALAHLEATHKAEPGHVEFDRALARARTDRQRAAEAVAK